MIGAGRHREQQAAAGNGLLNNLIGAWGFEETSGGTCYDSHGSNDGTITGATINQTGKVGQCYYFDGAGDSINFGNVVFPNAFTVTGWFKFTDKTSYRTLFAKGNLNGYSETFKVRTTTSGYLDTTVWKGTGYNYDAYVGSVDYSDGLWHFFCLSFDGDYHVVDIDNSNVYTSSALSGYVVNGGHNLLIGRSGHPFVHQYAKGHLDLYTLHGEVLSSTKKSALWNSGNGLSYSNFTS